MYKLIIYVFVFVLGVEAETNEVLEPTATSSKKTPKCRFFKKSGKCRFGEGCKFAHELQEGSPRDVSRGAISSGGSEDVGWGGMVDDHPTSVLHNMHFC